MGSALSGARGARNPKAKLNDASVKEIVALLRAEVPVNAIARRYRVCWSTVARIDDGTTWKHVPR